MDLEETIRQLTVRKTLVERAISEMEDLLESGVLRPGGDCDLVMKKRRGRKSMGADERHEVSQRMKRYWAKQHEKQKG